MVIERLAKAHPGIVVHAFDANTADNVFQRLRGHELDLMIGRSSHAALDDDLTVETLFEEPFLVVTGAQSPWARRRKLELADLLGEQWIFGEPTNATQVRISEAFRQRAGGLPPVRVFTTSMNLRLALLESGDYVSCIPGSTYRFGAQGRPLKALPVDMGLKLPVSIFMLRNRTPSPAVLHFVDCARETARSMDAL
jgi:DNA-binding transcriptional LysR family regulator